MPRPYAMSARSPWGHHLDCAIVATDGEKSGVLQGQRIEQARPERRLRNSSSSLHRSCTTRLGVEVETHDARLHRKCVLRVADILESVNANEPVSGGSIWDDANAVHDHRLDPSSSTYPLPCFMKS